SPSAERAARATARCPRWIGLKEPPRRPIRMAAGIVAKHPVEQAVVGGDGGEPLSHGSEGVCPGRGAELRHPGGSSLAAPDPERLLLELAIKRGVLDAQQARDLYAANRAQPPPGGLPETLVRRGFSADVVARLRAEVIATLRTQESVHLSKGTPMPQ